MRFLVIDLSNDSEIKILNTNIKKSINIISAYFIPTADENDSILAVAKKLSEEKLENIPAIIIPPRSIMKYQTFYFPSIPEKEIRKIIPREIQKNTDSTEEIIFDFKIGSQIFEKNEKKTEVIVYYIQKDDIWDMLNNLKANGILAVKVIPEIHSIESFIGDSFLPQTDGDVNGIVVIDMMSNKINMNIFNKNTWSLNREFQFKLVGDTSITDKDFSRISTEFSRTFQYFKQKNKNVSIDEAIIYGSNQNLSILNDFINENQPLNSTLISNIETNYKVIYPQNLKDENEFISMFFITITTANSIIKKDFIDLYPKEFTDKENFPRQILVFSLIGLAIFVTLAVVTTFYQKQKNIYRDDLKKIETEHNILQTQIDNIMKVRKKRKEYYEKIILMETPKKVSFQTADFIRELSLTVSNELSIKIIKLNIIYTDGKLEFSIDGKIYADSINGSLTEFGILLKKIKDLNRINVSNFTSPSSSNVTRDKNKISWNFIIQGERELVMEE